MESIYFFISLFVFSSPLFCSQPNINEEEFCFKDSDECSDGSKNLIEQKHNNFNNLIWSNINTALSKYEECLYSNCSCFLDVLNNDLQPFAKGISKKMIESIKSKGTTYVVYDKKLYRDKECMFPSRCSGIEYFLKKLLPELKNTEMVINTRDWPQVSRYFKLFGPVLSFSKNQDYLDIMYPAWAFWEGGPAIKTYPKGLGRWDLQRKSLIEESAKWPWEKKKSIGFFRGSRTSDQRDILILLSRKNPQLVDAQYTKNQAWKSADDTLGTEPAEVVSLEYHCKYKYLFNFKGVAASFRFKHLFLCGSLVIHVGQDWIEFFYPALKPWVHYIPISENSSESDIINLMNFLKENDSVAKEIAERGKKFVYDHLSLKEVKCYWRTLLKRYQSLLKYDIVLDKSLIEIK